MRFPQILLIIFLFFFPIDLFSQQTWSEDLIITPEKSTFVKTSTYEDVMKFLHSIQSISKQVHVFSMGKSLEGKDIPVGVCSPGIFWTALLKRKM